jgi:hypothetical protein
MHDVRLPTFKQVNKSKIIFEIIIEKIKNSIIVAINIIWLLMLNYFLKESKRP